MPGKSGSAYMGQLAASWDYDEDLAAWLVSVSTAVMGTGAKPTGRELLTVVLEELEALIQSLG